MKKKILNNSDKNLLLKDLCSRLPYGVIIETTWKEKYADENCDGTIGKLRGSQLEFFEDGEYSDIKPYLRPMSSMSEEEKNEYKHLINQYSAANPESASFWVDWLNANHFDYHGLIPKNLAIAVTEENNPYK